MINYFKNKRHSYEVLSLLELSKYWRYWVYKSIYQLHSFYKQTSIGIFWEPFSFLLITALISFVWTHVMAEKDFLSFYLYMLAGFYIWSFISSIMSDGTNVFRKHSRNITNERINLMFYILEDITFSLSKFLAKFPVVIIVILLYGEGNILTSVLLFIVVVGCSILSAIGYTMIFSTVCAFFKDVSFTIQAVMRIAFLLTPIVWRPERLGDYAKYLWLNPFYVYVKSSRDVLINSSIDIGTLTILVVQSALLFYIGYYVLGKSNHAVRKQAFQL